MRMDNNAEVLTLLRSGEPIEIGGGARADSAIADRHLRAKIILGFATLYLIWGSTYLGIRYAVETIPPFLMMGIRHFTAGAVVYAWARQRGAVAPTRKQWGYAVIAGAMLFLGGHGSLAWAEQKIPSGLAALLCATLPLWTVLLVRVKSIEHKLSAKVWAGILLGFAGVGVLIGPDAFRHSGTLNIVGVCAALFSSFIWAVGTIYSKGVRLPESTMLSASMQMLTGGVWLFLVALVSGEAWHTHLGNFSLRSIGALAYLIVFGSIIAFTAFIWLLTVASPSHISTYAYVNPVIAVFLGWAVAAERIGVNTLAATVIILISVALVNMRARTQVHTKAEEEVEELAS